MNARTIVALLGATLLNTGCAVNTGNVVWLEVTGLFYGTPTETGGTCAGEWGDNNGDSVCTHDEGTVAEFVVHDEEAVPYIRACDIDGSFGLIGIPYEEADTGSEGWAALQLTAMDFSQEFNLVENGADIQFQVTQLGGPDSVVISQQPVGGSTIVVVSLE